MTTLYRFARLALVLAALTGCAGHQMPHGLGDADCIGNCTNGTGTLRSQYSDLEYRGQWQDGQPATGTYAIVYQGQPFTAQYQNGRLVEGTKFYPHANFKLDYFTGTWQSYYDPFSRKTIIFPRRGIYHSITGATLTGEFHAIPSRGMFKDVYEDNPGTAMRLSSANLIFVGRLAYKGREEITTLARRGYLIGQPLISGIHGGLEPSDAAMLAGFKEELNREQAQQRQAQLRSDSSRMDFSQVIAIAATVAATSYAVNTGLGSADAAEIGSGFYNLAAEGDASGLTEIERKIAFARQREMAAEQVQATVNEIEQSYAPARSPAAQPVSSSPPARRKPVTAAQQPPVPDAAASQRTRVSVDIETSGETDAFFPYAQALNLAETKAQNRAYALCRADYDGRLVRDSGTLAKKKCDRNRNDEFRCRATMIFVCERR